MAFMILRIQCLPVETLSILEQWAGYTLLPVIRPFSFSAVRPIALIVLSNLHRAKTSGTHSARKGNPSTLVPPPGTLARVLQLWRKDGERKAKHVCEHPRRCVGARSTGAGKLVKLVRHGADAMMPWANVNPPAVTLRITSCLTAQSAVRFAAHGCQNTPAVHGTSSKVNVWQSMLGKGLPIGVLSFEAPPIVAPCAWAPVWGVSNAPMVVSMWCRLAVIRSDGSGLSKARRR